VTTTIATTMWVISSVHNNTTDTWTLTTKAVTTGFTDLNVLVLFVTDNTEGCSTFNVYLTDFTAWQT
jgi:hypothetical protein